jgi:hypothetical protein
MRALLEEWLSGAGFRLRVGASLGAQAPGTMDLVIVSVYMPKPAGAQLILELRVAYPGTALIALSRQFRCGLSSTGATPQCLGVAQADIFSNINILVVATVWNYTGLQPNDMAIRTVLLSKRTAHTTVNGVEHTESQSLNGISAVKPSPRRTSSSRTRRSTAWHRLSSSKLGPVRHRRLCLPTTPPRCRSFNSRLRATPCPRRRLWTSATTDQIVLNAE